MLYKFKSKVTGDVIMLQPNGERVLEIIGKHSATEPSTKGILLPEHMTAALNALLDAITQEDQQQKDATEAARREQQPLPRFDAVSLRQRSLPFMDMLRICLKEEQPITWGV